MVYIQTDIIASVVEYAIQNKIMMIGSPIEAYQKLISLLNQGLISYELTEDSDLSYEGAIAMIHILKMNSKCNLITAFTLHL